MEISYPPTISPIWAEANLSRLIAPGTIRNAVLDRLISDLQERYRTYCSYYPFGLWAPGLRPTNEMGAATELYLPMAEIRRAFRRFLNITLHYPPEPGRCPLDTSATWLDFLRRFRLDAAAANPAHLLRELTLHEDFRKRFFFTLLVPARHGESFLRYPAQISFLRKWLAERTGPSTGVIRCLDAACGTGEGTYDLARLFHRVGIPPSARLIHGCSIEPLEIFAAAHCFFPHDPESERNYRRTVEPLFAAGCAEGMAFFRDDVTRPVSGTEEPYDILVCNGLLGGPFIHDREDLAAAVSSLDGRIRPGGLLLAADRFHGGWKRKAPPALLEELLKGRGFDLIAIADGVAARKGSP